MYAIVSIAGQQFKVEKGKKLFVHRLAGNVGDEVSFNKVLLISDNDKVNIGVPFLPNIVVQAQIVSHLKGDKVLVFKKKRRKGYQKLNGHRQYFTEILIEAIGESVAPKKAEKKKPAETITPVEVEATTDKAAETIKVTTPKAAAKKASPKTGHEEKSKKAPVKKAAKPPAKMTAAKKPAEKKPAAKKPATKKPATKSESKPKK